MKFTGNKFKSIKTLNIINNSTVKSILIYNSIIWNSITKANSYQIEKVQNNYLRFLSYKIGKPLKYTDHNYQPLLDKFKIKTLKYSRETHDLLFLHKLVNNYIPCKDLVEHIKYFNMHNPVRGKIKIFDIYYFKNKASNLNRTMHLANLNKDWISIKNTTINKFNSDLIKNQVKFKTIIEE